jgi:uncharacterized protein (TIGR00159 family)
MESLDFTLLDAVDILIAGFLLYQLYRLIRGTAAIGIFLGISAVYLLWKLVAAFHMVVLTEMLGQFIGVGFLLLIIVFQQEIRRFLLMIGTATFTQKSWLAKPFMWVRGINVQHEELTVEPIVQAAINLAQTKTGALLVLMRKTPLGLYASTGTLLDARISAHLIEAIFRTKSPLHDGAMIFENDRIVAASAILPVSENINIPAKYGLRHRAAAGLTERNDSICVVVSEETGKISVVSQGIIAEVPRSKLKASLLELLST